MFWVRLGSSVVLVALALVFLLAGGNLLGAVTAVLSLIACRELMHACKVEKEGKTGALEWVGYGGILLYDALLILTKDLFFGIAIGLVFSFFATMFLYVFRFPHYHGSQIMAAFFCTFYAGIPFSFIYLTRELPHGIYLVWLIFISSWVCDTCAYLTGMAIGKHRLAPVLSPKKSVEGAIGGVAGSALAGALFAWTVLVPVIGDYQVIWLLALIGAIGSVIAQVGDLAASAIKRDHNLKDYGKLIPGHGGIMDRFDSVLFTAPVIYFLSVILL